MKTISNIPGLVLLLLAVNYASAQNCFNTSIVITDTIISQACTQNGQIDVGVTGGVGPYTFAWMEDYNTPVLATSQNLTSAYAGNYLLIVTDSHGACNTANIYLSPAFQIQVGTTQDTTCPAHSGSASVMGLGGQIPYSYLWSNGATSQSITNIAPGVYDATITDASGCEVVASHFDSAGIIVYAGNELGVSVTSTNPTTCQNNNGTITTTLTSGNAPFTYSWAINGTVAPSLSSGNLTGLSGNVYYTVTVTDGNGCVGYGYNYSMTFTSPVSLSATTTPQNCSNVNGTATVVANGSSGPFTYLWSTGSTAQEITGLAQNYYYITVTDANGCVDDTSLFVEYYSPIQANVTSTNQLCNASLGTASVSATLGTQPYSYLWSTGATTTSVTGLVPGYYYVQVNDNAGCSAEGYAYIALGSLITPNATQTDQVCQGALGTAQLAPTGGLAPYSYIWSNGATTASLSGLVSNEYTYTITDANGCQDVAELFINYNSGISGFIYPGGFPTCQLANGSLGFSVNAATYPLSYLWSNGSTDASPTNLTAGNYAVTVTQVSNGCNVVKEFYLASCSPLTAMVTVTPATCIFTNDGRATVSLGNGTPPYTYAWGNGSTTSTADSLPARWGIGVLVTDANGCTADAYQNSVGYQNLSCAAVIEGTIVDDLNQDCAFNAGDNVLQNVYIGCSPGHGTISSVYGTYRLLVPTGSYAITQNAQYRNQGCPTGSVVLDNLMAGTTYANNNFYDWPIDKQDLRVSFAAMQEPRPGFTHTIRVYYENNGLFPVSNAVITFNYDPTATYQGGGSAVNTSTYTVTIDCPLLTPSFGHGYTDLSFTTNTSTPLGTIQTYTANISPLIGDATPPNNTETQQLPVVSSYDPNFLEVAPKGNGTPGYISHNDSVLKYTIHFQNTGNYSATTVAIRDTLDPGLDPSTIQIGASSAPVTYELTDNVLIFILEPINLPDSSQDPVNSHGVVSFYIKQAKGLPEGTEIHNKTAIYFDYNQPVPTNAVLNTLDDTATGIPAISDEVNMQLIPNPSAGQTNVVISLQQNFIGTLEVTNLLGQMVHSEPLNLEPGAYTVPLNLETEASGIYLVRLKSSNASKCLKFVKTQ